MRDEYWGYSKVSPPPHPPTTPTEIDNKVAVMAAPGLEILLNTNIIRKLS